MTIQILETVNKDGSEWGISFTSHNPELKDYVEMKDAETAIKLKALIEKLIETIKE